MTTAAQFTLPATQPEPLRGHLRMGNHTSPAGNRIGINSRWLEWNGHPWLPIMGEFHFSRYPETEWERELRKIKAGGVTLLANYVFWIHHEEVAGQFDWSGQRDLRRFVELAGKVGLQVALRIGPFCHGECRNGGVPDWMYGQPFEIRSNDPRYLAIVERLYRQVFAQVKGLFFAEGGPLVALQVENEYLSTGALWETTHFPDTEWETAGAGGETHMAVLQELAQQVGFDPALWTCTGWGLTRFPADRFLPMFGGYAYYGWQDDPENHECSPNFVYRDMWTQAHQPPKAYDPHRVPYACCEIGGGMQVFYRHRPIVPPESVAAMNNVILANGSNLMGTYVYHGGINPDGKHAWLNEFRLPRRSYDFQAPLGEYGQRRPHYDSLRRLYYFIQRTETALAPAAPLLPEAQPLLPATELASLRCAVRADAQGRGYLFLNNFQDHAEMPPKADVRVTVKTGGEQLRFPAVGQLDLATGANLILPFNLDLDGICLKQSGTQFITSRRDPGRPEQFFFFAPAGMDTPHYRFVGPVTVTGAGASVIVTTLGADTLVTVPAGHRSRFTVACGAASAQITTLTTRESLDFWQDRCGDRLVTLLTNAGVIFHENGIELYQTSTPEFSFAILTDTDAPALGADAATLTALGLDEGFAQHAARVPAWTGGVTLVPLKAGKHHVTLSPHVFDGIHELFLRVGYQGDTGMAFVAGTLVHDNFNNDTPWEIGLQRYRPAVETAGVVLRVVPKPCVGGSCTQDAMGAGALAGGDFQNVAIDRIEAVPEYRLRLKFT
jgi:hypothetical protein